MGISEVKSFITLFGEFQVALKGIMGRQYVRFGIIKLL